MLWQRHFQKVPYLVSLVGEGSHRRARPITLCLAVSPSL